MYKWILPSLSEVLANSQSILAECSSAKAELQWRVSVAATEHLLLSTLGTASPDTTQGLVLAAPAPVFSDTRLTQSLQTVTFTAKPFNPLALMPFQMPDVGALPEEIATQESVLPLLSADPLAREQFCLVFTDKFRLVLVLAQDNNGNKTFSFSFESEVVEQAWRSLGARVMLSNPDLFADLEKVVQKYFPVIPDYRSVMQFSQLLLLQLPELQEDKETGRQREITPSPQRQLQQDLLTDASSFNSLDQSNGLAPQRTGSFSSRKRSANVEPQRHRESRDPHCPPTPKGTPKHPIYRLSPQGTPSSPLPPNSKEYPEASHSSSARPDVELLQAFAHEVRTPLTTIRTTTRLLLKQRDLPANVIKRLELIDRECTEQIDRMELLFRAAELETSASSVKCTNTQLTAMSLEQVLQQSIPRWQQAANRRNLTLDVIIPQQLPTVVSNPNMLDRVLTGLMENFTRSLPAGSHIQIQVIPAGDQLKLQLLPKPQSTDNSIAVTNTTPPIRKAIGQLLMFQPETGTISLNLAATKHLFQAIGGKLIVRERPHHGEVLTIFLPLKE